MYESIFFCINLRVLLNNMLFVINLLYFFLLTTDIWLTIKLHHQRMESPKREPPKEPLD